MRLRQAKKIMGWCKGDGDYYTIHRSKDHRDSFWRKMQKLRPAYINENGVYVQPSMHEMSNFEPKDINALRHEEVEACARYIGMLRTKHVARISTCFNIEDRDVGKNLMVCASNRGVFIDQKPDNMLKQIKETRIKHGWR